MDDRVKYRWNKIEEAREEKQEALARIKFLVGSPAIPWRWLRCWWWSMGDRRLRSRTHWRQLRRSLKNLGQKVTVVCSPFNTELGKRTTHARFYHEHPFRLAANTRWGRNGCLYFSFSGSLIIWIANSRHRERRVIPLLGH